VYTDSIEDSIVARVQYYTGCVDLSCACVAREVSVNMRMAPERDMTQISTIEI